MYDIQAERSSEKLHRQGFRPPGLLTLCAQHCLWGGSPRNTCKGSIPVLKLNLYLIHNVNKKPYKLNPKVVKSYLEPKFDYHYIKKPYLDKKRYTYSGQN